MKKAFGKIDLDHNGVLDLDEMRQYVSHEEQYIMETIFTKFNKDGNGEIDFDEFKDMMLHIIKGFDAKVEINEFILDQLEEELNKK